MKKTVKDNNNKVVVTRKKCHCCGNPCYKHIRCSRCKLAHYCGATCFKKDFKKHKPNCVPPHQRAMTLLSVFKKRIVNKDAFLSTIELMMKEKLFMQGIIVECMEISEKNEKVKYIYTTKHQICTLILQNQLWSDLFKREGILVLFTSYYKIDNITKTALLPTFFEYNPNVSISKKDNEKKKQTKKQDNKK